MKRIQISLRVLIAAVALSAVVVAACISVCDWLREMEKSRHYYLAEAAGYARDEGFSKAAWQSSLTHLESMKVRAKETLELVRKTRLEEEPLRKSVSKEVDPLGIEIESLLIESENDAKRMVEQAEHSVNFWFEDMIYSSAMKQRYLSAASHPWQDAPGYLEIIFSTARKTGDIPK